jgi:hypothetical protein
VNTSCRCSAKRSPFPLSLLAHFRGGMWILVSFFSYWFPDRIVLSCEACDVVLELIHSLIVVVKLVANLIVF